MSNFNTMSPFLDPIDRVSDKPRSQEDGITDNPLLFSGEAALLFKVLGLYHRPEYLKLKYTLDQVQVVPGLFRRQPESLQNRYNIPRNAVSHDEYNGICFMVASCPDYLRKYAVDIVEYGQKYGWQYNDIAPNWDFFEFLLNDPIKAIKSLLAYIKDKKQNPQDTNSVDLRHPGYVIALGQWRQPRDRAFYKITAAQNPTLFEIFNLAVATVFSSLGDVLKSRGGTKLMSWFRILAIKTLNKKSLLLDLSFKFFDWNMTRKLGTNYPTILATNYFDRKDEGLSHPLIELIDRYCKTPDRMI